MIVLPAHGTQVGALEDTLDTIVLKCNPQERNSLTMKSMGSVSDGIAAMRSSMMTSTSVVRRVDICERGNAPPFQRRNFQRNG